MKHIEQGMNNNGSLVLLTLLVTLLFSVQVCSAYMYQIDFTIIPSSVYVNSPANLSIHVYDGDHGDWVFPYAQGNINVTPPSGTNLTIPFTTNVTGWALVPYTATNSGTFTFIAKSSYDYNTTPYINVGVQSATSLSRTLMAIHKSDKIGIFRPSSGIWSLDSNGNFTWEGSDTSLSWGLPNDIPVIGDWNGDGKEGIGIFRPNSGIWSLDSNENFVWEPSDKSLSWGLPGDIPVIGDWNSDGKDGIGIFRPSSGIWSIDSNENFVWEVSDKSLSWGLPNDKPVVGKY